jgi:hypothetical protein
MIPMPEMHNIPIKVFNNASNHCFLFMQSKIFIIAIKTKITNAAALKIIIERFVYPLKPELLLQRELPLEVLELE